MNLIPLEKIKETLSLKRIYGEDISLEEVIEKKIKPHKFSPKKIEKYKEKYYLGAYYFINTPNYLTVRVLYDRFLEGDEDEGFKEWFINQVHQYVFQETTDYGTKNNRF